MSELSKRLDLATVRTAIAAFVDRLRHRGARPAPPAEQAAPQPAPDVLSDPQPDPAVEPTGGPPWEAGAADAAPVPDQATPMSRKDC
jgi:hypothetical protein